MHIASFDAHGVLHCTDEWESEQALDDFLQQRLMPAVARAGITTQPTVEIDPCHEVFVARINTITIPEQQRVLAATPV